MSLAADISSNIKYIDFNYIAPISKYTEILMLILNFIVKTNYFEDMLKLMETLKILSRLSRVSSFFCFKYIIFQII